MSLGNRILYCLVLSLFISSTCCAYWTNEAKNEQLSAIALQDLTTGRVCLVDPLKHQKAIPNLKGLAIDRLGGTPSMEDENYITPNCVQSEVTAMEQLASSINAGGTKSAYLLPYYIGCTVVNVIAMASGSWKLHEKEVQGAPAIPMIPEYLASAVSLTVCIPVTAVNYLVYIIFR